MKKQRPLEPLHLLDSVRDPKPTKGSFCDAAVVADVAAQLLPSPISLCGGNLRYSPSCTGLRTLKP